MKERLTGAIILVILIVLLVPELLSGPKGPAAAGAAPTSSEEPPLRSYTINLGDDSHSRTATAGSNGPAMPQPSGPEQPTAQPGTPAGTSEAASSATMAAQNEAGQVAAGTPPQTPEQPTSRAAKPVVTPAPTLAHVQKPAPQTSAATTRTETRKTTRTAPATQKPAKTHAAAANVSTNSQSAWGVQLGVFASRENAERLALDVRVKGFKASVSPVSSGGRKLYRVRVGPTADRAAAQELQGRLKASGRPGGTVVPYS